MLEIARDAILKPEKAPAGCSMLTPSFETKEMLEKLRKVIGHMLKIFRNVVFMGETAPAGCSELAKGL